MFLLSKLSQKFPHDCDALARKRFAAEVEVQLNQHLCSVSPRGIGRPDAPVDAFVAFAPAERRLYAALRQYVAGSATREEAEHAIRDALNRWDSVVAEYLRLTAPAARKPASSPSAQSSRIAAAAQAKETPTAPAPEPKANQDPLPIPLQPSLF